MSFTTPHRYIKHCHQIHALPNVLCDNSPFHCSSHLPSCSAEHRLFSSPSSHGGKPTKPQSDCPRLKHFDACIMSCSFSMAPAETPMIAAFVLLPTAAQAKKKIVCCRAFIAPLSASNHTVSDTIVAMDTLRIIGVYSSALRAHSRLKCPGNNHRKADPPSLSLFSPSSNLLPLCLFLKDAVGVVAGSSRR